VNSFGNVDFSKVHVAERVHVNQQFTTKKVHVTKSQIVNLC